MASDTPNARQPDPAEQGHGDTERRRGRILGVIPNSRRNRAFFAWGVANALATFLPVWDVVFNSAEIVGNILPVTILWSYLVFASNMLLGIVLYFTWARGWATSVEERGLLQRSYGDATQPSGEES